MKLILEQLPYGLSGSKKTGNVVIIPQTIDDAILLEFSLFSKWRLCKDICNNYRLNENMNIGYNEYDGKPVCAMVRGWPENKTEVFLKLRNTDDDISDLANILIRSKTIEVEDRC